MQVSDVQEDLSTPAPTLALGPGSDTGMLDNDNLRNNPVIVVTGIAEALATITVSDARGTAIGSAKANQDGVWTLSGVNLATLKTDAGVLGADGFYTLSAQAVDLALNQSTVTTLRVELDTTPPPAPLTLKLDSVSDSAPVGDGKTTILAPNFTVTLPTEAASNDRLDLRADLDDNGSYETSVSISSLTAAQIASGAVTLSIDAHVLPDNHPITFLATLVDEAGNVSKGNATTAVAFITDFDGITPATEGAGAGGGDFNGDGLSDAQQGDVATAPMTNANDFTNAANGNGDNLSHGLKWTPNLRQRFKLDTV